MDTEEEKILTSIARRVDTLIDKEFDRFGIDRGYFDFDLSVKILSIDFQIMEKRTLLTGSKSFCSFCEKETSFYDRTKDIYLCAECFSKVYPPKNK